MPLLRWWRVPLLARIALLGVPRLALTVAGLWLAGVRLSPRIVGLLPVARRWVAGLAIGRLRRIPGLFLARL
ncbi:MAG: hypothetical protein ACRDQ1_00670, partial [Sciscionella sp.]